MGLLTFSINVTLDGCVAGAIRVGGQAGRQAEICGVVDAHGLPLDQ